MGCDIHAIVEVKQNGNWEFVEELKINRYYPLFAMLANVRNTYDFTPLCNGRGIPANASDEFIKRRSEFGSATHSWTYFTIDDLLSDYWMEKEQGKRRLFIAGSFFRDVVPRIFEHGETHGNENVRVLVFFDN